MALWLDKHRPKKLGKLDFHKKQAEHLEKLVKSGDFPHLLVHGPPGAGKKTRIMALLREMYGNGVDRLRIEHQTYETPSKKKIDITTIASNYHIEVNPSDAGIYDRIVRTDWDAGFVEGRQFGRGKSGGQVRDEYRTDFDGGRGGYGMIVKQKLEIPESFG